MKHQPKTGKNVGRSKEKRATRVRYATAEYMVCLIIAWPQPVDVTELGRDGGWCEEGGSPGVRIAPDIKPQTCVMAAAQHCAAPGCGFWWQGFTTNRVLAAESNPQQIEICPYI